MSPDTSPLPATLDFSPHAERRAQQRAVSREAVAAALDWGRRLRQRDGRTAFHLGRRDVTRAEQLGVDLRSYEGTVVVVASDGTVVTVIRTRDGRRLRLLRHPRRSRTERGKR